MPVVCAPSCLSFLVVIFFGKVEGNGTFYSILFDTEKQPLDYLPCHNTNYEVLKEEKLRTRARF